MTSPGRAWLLAAVAAYLLLATGWLFWTPALEAADESTHLQYALHIAQAGELPVVRGTAARLGLPAWDEETQAFHPPLYYASIAGLAHLLGRADTLVALRVNEARAGRGRARGPGAAHQAHGALPAAARGAGLPAAGLARAAAAGGARAGRAADRRRRGRRALGLVVPAQRASLRGPVGHRRAARGVRVHRARAGHGGRLGAGRPRADVPRGLRGLGRVGRGAAA